MPSVSAHVANALANHISHVYGVMGNGNAYFLDALERLTDVAYVAVRHEAGGVVAADAYHRAGGGLAGATATYGAGFTNTLTALAESAQARVPLVLVAGDKPSSGARPWDVDQQSLATSIGVPTFTVSLDDATATTLSAIAHAMRHRMPVVLAIPYDIAHREAGTVPSLSDQGNSMDLTHEMTLSPEAADEISAAIADAKRPLLLAGRGAWLSGARDALGALADASGALTATTALGRNLFPREEYDLGIAGGFGQEGAMDVLQDADVAVVFGASLNQFTMRFGDLFGSGTRVIQIDTAPDATHPRVDRFFQADAATAAGAITTAIERRSDISDRWRESIDIAPLRTRELGEELAPDGRLDPRSVAARIAELLPANRVVVSDGGHFIGWANMYWPVASPDRMLMVGTAYQSIGLGFPSVPGAALAKPEATIVLTTGDGGGLMALADLESAVRVAGGRGLAVVWNDGAYGAEVNLYGVKGLSQAPMLIPEVDFAQLARSVGADGAVVRRIEDLERLAEWAALPESERPFLLLDVRISTSVIAPYQQEIIRINS